MIGKIVALLTFGCLWPSLGVSQQVQVPMALQSPAAATASQPAGPSPVGLEDLVGGLTLPVDLEPYGPGESEYAAAQRLLRRVVEHLGPRFADYVVGDGESRSEERRVGTGNRSRWSPYH